MKYVVLFLFLFGITFMLNSAYALPQINLEDLYKSHDLVLFGKVISREDGPGPNFYYYHISVEEYYKNPKTSKMITVSGPKEPNPRGGDQIFDIGDKAIFFLKKIDNVYVISSYSIKSDVGCSGNLLINLSKIPNELLERGTPSHNLRFTDINGNAMSQIHTNDDVLINFDGWNQDPILKSSNFTLYIYDQNSSLFFNNTKHIEFEPCSFKNMSWHYEMPSKSGNYSMTLLSYNIANTISFEILPTNSTVSLDKAVYPMVDSPLKQFKSGMSIPKITCKESLSLVTKHDGSPACVKTDSIAKIAERSWMFGHSLEQQKKLENAHGFVHYRTSSANVISIHAFSQPISDDCQGPGCGFGDGSSYMSIDLTPTTNPQMFSISIPREIMDSKINNLDDGFFVLVNDQEVNYAEKKDNTARTLIFSIPQNTDEIRILGIGQYNKDLPRFPFPYSTGIRSLPYSIDYDIAEGKFEVGWPYITGYQLNIPIKNNQGGIVNLKIPKEVFEKELQINFDKDSFKVIGKDRMMLDVFDHTETARYILFSVPVDTGIDNLIITKLRL